MLVACLACMTVFTLESDHQHFLRLRPLVSWDLESSRIRSLSIYIFRVACCIPPFVALLGDVWNRCRRVLSEIWPHEGGESLSHPLQDYLAELYLKPFVISADAMLFQLANMHSRQEAPDLL